MRESKRRPRYSREIARAALAAFLTPDDVATVLRINRRLARSKMLAGAYGAVLPDGGRIYVSREAFVAAMDAKAVGQGGGGA